MRRAAGEVYKTLVLVLVSDRVVQWIRCPASDVIGRGEIAIRHGGSDMKTLDADTIIARATPLAHRRAHEIQR
jgi:hypothetical protein